MDKTANGPKVPKVVPGSSFKKQNDLWQFERYYEKMKMKRDEYDTR